jgi:DNA polymerase
VKSFINMLRDFLELMNDSLADLKREGVGRVSISEENLRTLRKTVESLSVKESSPTPITGETTPKMPKPVEHASPPPRQHIKENTIPFDSPRAKEPPASHPPKASPAKPAFATAPLPPPPSFEIPAGDKETQRTWLRDRVLNCPVCQEHVRPGKKIVFGVGSVDAEIFFCGEAPGADEETKGEPFVGPAGQLLTKIIQAMGLGREQVYIGNIMNWRPEMPTVYGNRPPTTEEMAFCLPYLQAQVTIVKPKVIVALGATAIEGLLGPDPMRKIGAIHGRWHAFNGIPLMPTYHPSYLLRNGTNKSKRVVWEDMMLVMDKIGISISDRQRNYFL